MFPWPHHEGIRRSTSIPPLIHNRGIRWRCVVNFRTQPLYPRRRTAVSIQPEAGLAPEPVWTFRRGKKCLQPTGISTPDRPANSVVAIPTKLLRLPKAEVIKGITPLLDDNRKFNCCQQLRVSLGRRVSRTLARTNTHS